MKTRKTTGLPDSTAYNKHLLLKKFTIDSLGELADATTSSHEDAVSMLDNQDEIADQLNANVTKNERKLLDDAAKKVNSSDQTALENTKPDQYDDDAESLNEKIGEEDKENNSYSMGNKNKDDNNTRQ